MTRTRASRCPVSCAAGSHAGSHTDEQPSDTPDPAERPGGDEPEVTNRSEQGRTPTRESTDQMVGGLRSLAFSMSNSSRVNRPFSSISASLASSWTGERAAIGASFWVPPVVWIARADRMRPEDVTSRSGAIRSHARVEQEQLAATSLDPHDRLDRGPRGQRVQHSCDSHPFDRPGNSEPAADEPAASLDQAGTTDLHVFDLAVAHLSEHLGLTVGGIAKRSSRNSTS